MLGCRRRLGSRATSASSRFPLEWLLVRARTPSAELRAASANATGEFACRLSAGSPDPQCRRPLEAATQFHCVIACSLALSSDWRLGRGTRLEPRDRAGRSANGVPARVRRPPCLRPVRERHSAAPEAHRIPAGCRPLERANKRTSGQTNRPTSERRARNANKRMALSPQWPSPPTCRPLDARLASKPKSQASVISTTDEKKLISRTEVGLFDGFSMALAWPRSFASSSCARWLGASGEQRVGSREKRNWPPD